MTRRHIFRARLAPAGRLIAIVAPLAFVASYIVVAADGQTRTARDTATAYGARLNAKGEPADLNPNRINNRANSRLETRLSLRIERYRSDSTSDPDAAFSVKATDNARVGTDTTLSPLATSTPSATSQGFKALLQTSPRPADDAARPR